ncbi:SRPBCC domain-containing protein [Rhizobium leguminosarum]|uniref:SRPBCC family protein n=1 Tax=Rhizobium leguminosarum TaxID=384 RepID=UPI00102FCC30|nr:SRPBCC domain-containing protein [Rhizobium leguminosarum]TAX57711.1 SRPBCC domain-containing protein [Rhizobium leguminosarum]TAX62052.1 SRPBCC domain-containing protein [Rhizobium leguminosarum]TAY03581.1 SRPBCC domain-containing protein [Rhizobium leguminosarum]
MKTRVPASARAHFMIERSYATATLDDVWALWTTSVGIEAWWGPEGFDVAVTFLDLRPGGELVYTMTATAPQQVEFMKRAGMPLTTECTVRYTEVSPPHRLAYSTIADFIPGVAPYEVATVVDFNATAQGVTLAIRFDAMHDDIWTERARAGHESQMRKLDRLIAAQQRAGLA